MSQGVAVCNCLPKTAWPPTCKVRESREHEAEDRKRRELVEARNTGDSLAYQTEKTLHELGDRVPGNERETIQGRINALRESLKGDDSSRIKQQTDELQNAFHALSQQLYAQQAGQGQPQGGGNNGQNPDRGGRQGPKDEGEVVEGEFHEA